MASSLKMPVPENFHEMPGVGAAGPMAGVQVSHRLPELPPFLCNTGGPMSRTRTERIFSSLLAGDNHVIRSRRVIQLALDFGSEDPLDVIYRVLRGAAVESPEALRGLCEIPGERLLCKERPLDPIDARASEPALVLRQALMLGLCTRVLFDPARPVLWTHASLTRRVELCAIENFYDA